MLAIAAALLAAQALTDSTLLPQLGVMLVGQHPGVEVTRVENPSPAQAAGLKLGDRIEFVDETLVLSTSDFERLLKAGAPGASLRIELWRDAEPATVFLSVPKVEQPNVSRQETQYCASHILVKVQQGESGQGHKEPEAKAIAGTLLRQVNAGADFAAIAKMSSEDAGTSANGGNLGCFAPGQMVPEFEAALDQLQPGQTSGLVKTPFGYHIIRLVSKRVPVEP